MKVGYFDCFSGISGDMALGALIDAGADFSRLKKELKKIALTGYSISANKQMRNQISGTRLKI